MNLTEIVTAVRADLNGALIALDFDGTLAPIVTDPAESRPMPGTIEVLTSLAARGVQVAVITGRDARTVIQLSGLDTVPGLIVEGLYGAETWTAGDLSTPDTPAAIRTLRKRLPALLAEHGADPAVWIEDKRLSLVVHGRRAADPDSALRPLQAPVADLARELAFEVHAGRDVIELRLPGFDKAGALRRLVEQCGPRSVLFAGDDLGDLPAFAEIRSLRAGGMFAWGVGVLSPDVPELAAAADVHVDGPAGVVALLRDVSA